MNAILGGLQMRKTGFAFLYMGFGLLANGAAALDLAGLQALREGDMRKLTLHAEPQRGSGTIFFSEDGAEMTLADLEGQIVVLNFWATWCAPCRVEMPHLSALQADLGGDDFRVVTVATGRNPLPAIQMFFDEIGVDNLPLYTDPRQALARDMGVLGLPVTIILDREGQEIGRLVGDADWASDSARAILTALIGAE